MNFTQQLIQLQDSQDSISRGSKWLLSQHDKASTLASQWEEFMKRNDIDPKKKLLAIYLVNHAVQQTKDSHIDLFLDKFGQSLIRSFTTVFSDFPPDLQKKIQRVVNIWKVRNVFTPDIIQQLEKALRISSSGGSSTKRESRNNDKSGGVAIPEALSDILNYYNKISKHKHNIPALKNRFDNAINELDPNSVVYEANFQTVQHIGKATKKTVNESMDNRKLLITVLEKLLLKTKDELQQEESLINEIDFALNSKDPNKISKETVDNDDLPTYANYDNASDSNSDSDSDSDSKPKSIAKPVTNTGMNTAESTNSIIGSDKIVSKRDITETEEYDVDNAENGNNKKIKQDNLEEKEVDEYTVYVNDNNDDNDNNDNNEGTNVTSNIQDLLSRLAN